MTALQSNSRIQRLRYPSFDKEREERDLSPLQSLHGISTPPPAPAMSEEELNAIRREGYASGYQEGVQVTEEKQNKEAVEREESLKALLGTMANRISLAGEAHKQAIEQQRADMHKLSLAVARKFAGDALKQVPLEGVEKLLNSCASMIAGQSRIVIEVAPKLAGELKQQIDALRPLLHGFEGEIAIEENAELGEQDCRVHWKNGHAEHDQTKLWSDIESLIMQTTTASTNEVNHG